MKVLSISQGAASWSCTEFTKGSFPFRQLFSKVLNLPSRWKQQMTTGLDRKFLSFVFKVLMVPAKEDILCTSRTVPLCLNGISHLLAKLWSRNSANGDPKSNYVMMISHLQWKEPALDGLSLFADQKTNTVWANKDSPNLLNVFLCQLSELRGVGGNMDSISSLHREKSPVSTGERSQDTTS